MAVYPIGVFLLCWDPLPSQITLGTDMITCGSNLGKPWEGSTMGIWVGESNAEHGLGNLTFMYRCQEHEESVRILKQVPNTKGAHSFHNRIVYTRENLMFRIWLYNNYEFITIIRMHFRWEFLKEILETPRRGGYIKHF